MMLDDTSPKTLTIQMTARSDMGNVRASNEDNLYYVGRFRDVHEDVGAPYRDSVHYAFDGGLFAVCDGMGGEAYGEEASLIAVSGLSRLEMTLLQEPPAHWDAAMRRYLELANAQICQRIRMHEGQRMGTTLVALFLRGDRAKIINLGDSRAYRWMSERPHPGSIDDDASLPVAQAAEQAPGKSRGQRPKLEQMTIDHTQAQRLADIGIIEPSEVRRHPERHRLLQHLGVFPSEAELKPYSPPSFRAQVGEIYLLCSDGLNDSLSEEEMEELFSAYEAHGDLDQLADDLMARALERGGNDNITFLLLRVEELGDVLDYGADDEEKEAREDTGTRHSETRNVTAIDALDLNARTEAEAEPPQVFEALEAMQTLPEAWMNLENGSLIPQERRGRKDQTSEIPSSESMMEDARHTPPPRPSEEGPRLSPPEERSPYARPLDLEDAQDPEMSHESFFNDSEDALDRSETERLDHGETRPLTPSFIEAMRQSTRDIEQGMDELGTIPQINPVRVGAKASSEREDGSNDDTIARNEGERDWALNESDGRVIAQPITTDDLERFRKAREESLRRQQIYEQEDRDRGYNHFTQNDRRLNVYAQMERERAAKTEGPSRPEEERSRERRARSSRRSNAASAPPARGRVPGFRRYLLDLLLGVLIGFFLCFVALNLGNLF